MNAELSKAFFDFDTKSLTADRLLNVRLWTINELAYPIIDITFTKDGRNPFRVKLNCNAWNENPPSIELLSVDGNYLTRLPSGSGVLNPGPHPLTGRPFICTVGSIEYHTHTSHITDHWENYKGKPSYDLGGIITQIWNAWRKTND